MENIVTIFKFHSKLLIVVSEKAKKVSENIKGAVETTFRGTRLQFDSAHAQTTEMKYKRFSQSTLLLVRFRRIGGHDEYLSNNSLTDARGVNPSLVRGECAHARIMMQ